MKTTISVERLIGAPPDVIYHCIADYREHHRPDGFLPPAFTDMEIASGGVGAGTTLSWVVETGGRRRTVEATISEPEPGRVMIEDSPEIKTTFTVERQGLGAMVRFDTIIDEGGVQGVLNRLFAARLLEPIYREELRRLEEYARRHGPLAASVRGAA
jgi:Polyketide cyclase / dehydrase and lipid transport